MPHGVVSTVDSLTKNHDLCNLNNFLWPCHQFLIRMEPLFFLSQLADAVWRQNADCSVSPPKKIHNEKQLSGALGGHEMEH